MNFTHEFYDLAMVLVELDPSSSDEFQDEERVTELLLKKYRFDNQEDFEKLIRDLLPLVAVGQSTLAPQQSYKGFAFERNWLCKVPVEH